LRYDYIPRGVCARKISFDLENGIVSNVEFQGGCNGNLKAIAKLVEGKKADEISDILAGNTCGMKNTSCADQLARALKTAVSTESEA
jgi:uncharacterized protein (TIGR03905 family)